jgi:hypothetical protein
MDRQKRFIEEAIRRILAGDSQIETKSFDIARREGIGKVYFTVSKEPIE